MVAPLQPPTTQRTGRYRLETIDAGASATYQGNGSLVIRFTIWGRGTTNVDVPGFPTQKINTPENIGYLQLSPLGQYDYDQPFVLQNGTSEQIVVELLSLVP